MMRQRLTYHGIPLWRHSRVIQWTAQIVSVFVTVGLVVWFFANIANAIQERDIPYGFGFLSRSYQTPIGIHFIPYESSDTFLYAFGVAAVNTVVVAVIGVVLATILGIVMGVLRLSGNWIVSRVALVYIEFFRNVPLIVQLFFWFYIMLTLPPVREGYVLLKAIYINNAGVSFPWIASADRSATLVWLVLSLAAMVVGIITHRRLSQREIVTGQASYPVIVGYSVAIVIGVVTWLGISAAFGEAPFSVSVPEPQGRFGRISGGFTAQAGLLVLLVGLVLYTAAFIAEIVRAGIQSVSRGQTEAARAIGLSQINTLQLVVFPQALRVIIPPWISQCLNLTKNSSLGVAIGYAELTGVAQTMTQTAPAINIFLMLMAAYLAMSLTWSLIGNLYNRHIRFTG